MEDRKNLKEYREIYKEKNRYTSWKKAVRKEIAATEKVELINMKKLYEIKLKKEKYRDEMDDLATYNSNILAVLISLSTTLVTMLVGNIGAMGSVISSLSQSAANQKKFALECIDTISNAFTISIGDVSKVFILLLVALCAMHFFKHCLDDRRFFRILYYEEVVQLIDIEIDRRMAIEFWTKTY